MTSRTPEEYRRWLFDQTEKCLRESNRPIDTIMAAAIGSAAQDDMAVLEQVAATRRKVADKSERD